MTTNKTAEEILIECGALLTNGHFVLTSGRHSHTYMNKDAVYPHTRLVSDLCDKMARPFGVLERVVEAVIGPAMGGIVLSQWTASHLGAFQGNKVLSLYAERDGDSFVVKRGYDKLLFGKNVLVVEDVITTGDTTKKVIKVVRSHGGNVVGVSAIYNRGEVTSKDLEVRRLVSQVNFQIESWAQEECPLCAQDIPVNTDVGKGRDYLIYKGL